MHADFRKFFDDVARRTLMTMFNYSCCGQRLLKPEAGRAFSNYKDSLKNGVLSQVLAAFLKIEPEGTGYQDDDIDIIFKAHEIPRAAQAAFRYAVKVTVSLANSVRAYTQNVEAGMFWEYFKAQKDIIVNHMDQTGCLNGQGYCCGVHDDNLSTVLKIISENNPIYNKQTGYADFLKTLPESWAPERQSKVISMLLNHMALAQTRGQYTRLDGKTIDLG